MTTNNFIQKWIKALAKAALNIVALVAYGSRREWLLTFFSNLDFLKGFDHNWLLGFFEGTITMTIVYYFINKYGQAISETILGLRELARSRKK